MVRAERIILLFCTMNPNRHQIPYGIRAERQIIDLFTPSTEDGTAPLLIFLHGGAWVSESNADHYDLAQYIAAHSHTVVALVEYRLTSKDDSNTIYYPSHIRDVFEALQELFVQDNAVKFRYSTKGVTLAGHSAGAWMTLAVALDSHSPSQPLLGSREHCLPAIPALSSTIRASIKAFVCSVCPYVLRLRSG